MVADLETKLKSGAKALIGNRGYRRYLKTEIENGGKRFLVRSRAKGATVAILRCAGARLPLTIRCIDEPAEGRENPAAA